MVERIRYNLLCRWLIGLAIDDEVWDHSVFSKNRDRLLDHAVVERFFTEVMQLADKRQLLSKEHFSVDGTLIQAWASHKSFVRKDGNDDTGTGGSGRNALADWAQQRHTCEHDRPGCTLVQEEPQHRGDPGLPEARADGATTHHKLTMTASNITRMARMLSTMPQGAMT